MNVWGDATHLIILVAMVILRSSYSERKFSHSTQKINIDLRNLNLCCTCNMSNQAFVATCHMPQI